MPQDLSFMLELGFTESIVERFNRKLGRIPNGCLIWLGATHGFGHGVISRGGRGTGVESAHRVAWMLANGPIPEGKFVCHHCDTPPCCEVTHLYIGDAASNTDDIRRRGRFNALRGEDSPRCRISDETVRQMRAEYPAVRSYTKVGRMHGVDASYARSIILGLVRATA
jgi:hypothetical protein